VLRLLFGFPGSTALVQTCTQDRTRKATATTRCRGQCNVAGIDTEMANEGNVAYGASLGGVCEAADTWDALAGARADED
jgi:molybdenum cofactor biosynthesis enzyme